MIDDNDILKQWDIVSEIWKSSERQKWFHNFILEPFFIKYLSKEIYGNREILDYGCGSGELLEVILELGFQAEGFEPCFNLYKKSCKKKIKVFNQLPSEIMKTYDIIILNLVLSAVNNPFAILKSAKSILRSKGRIIVTIPHPCFSIISKYHKTTKREWLTKHLNGEEDILKYFSNPIQKIHWDSQDNYFTLNFYRTIDWYSNLFNEANLKTENIFEPKPTTSPKSMDDLFEIYSCFPSFMIFILYEQY